jgi:pimeloyl-ACP methyl ester carboxylesterase
MIKKIITLSALAIISSYSLNSYASSINTHDRVNNIVLVHGAYADGSGWKGVFHDLHSKGYNVWVAQLPETSLKADVDTVNRIVNLQKGPVILVGHSYGGIVVTQAGNNPKVKGLVYVAAVVPKANEEIKSLRVRFKAPANDVIKIGDGFQILNPKTFHQDFAADISKSDAEFMAYSQVPVAVPKALGASITKAAWAYKPSWYIVANQDRKINPELELFMAKRAGSKIYKFNGSHAIFSSEPQEISNVIISASISLEHDKNEKLTYTIKKGDTLSLIANKFLGKSSLYPEIAKLNNIKNVNLIKTGQVILI